MKLSSHEIAWLVLRAGFSEYYDAPTMVAIILATSGGDPDYLSFVDSDAGQDQHHGLAGISSLVHQDQLVGMVNWRDPLTNVKMARKIYIDSANNFTFWETFTTNQYKAFLPMAHAGITNPIEPLPDSFTLEILKNSTDTVKLSAQTRDTTNTIESIVTEFHTALVRLTRVLDEIRTKFS